MISISIHALLAESDITLQDTHHFPALFLSTLSLRRATNRNLASHCRNDNFYPRSPCGERHSADCSCRNAHPISIHALLAESDDSALAVYTAISPFLSTLSLRRATRCPTRRNHHAKYFYPRSPCGERHEDSALRRATEAISIHALLAESDRCSSCRVSGRRYFYPRSPCGERQLTITIHGGDKGISIHALLAESDPTPVRPGRPTRLFLSTLSLRRAT